MKLAHIIEKVMFNPWLITVGGYESVVMLINSKLNDPQIVGNMGLNATYTLSSSGTGGLNSSIQPLAEDFQGTTVEWKVDNDQIAHIPIRGVLGQRLSGLEKVCGGTDYLDIQKATDEALGRGARGIMYAFDSSGGMVRGCEDLASYIHGLKVPTQAYTDSRCNSAAYWLASACNEMMASASSDVGSIGVILPWVDKAKVWEVEGLKYDPFVNDGADLKGAGAGPSLTDTQKRYLQECVNYVGEKFQQFVNSSRKVKSEVFRAGTYFGDQALNVGLINGVGSYDDAYKSLLTRVKNGDRAPVPMKMQVKAKMTKEELKTQFPELYNTLVQENESAARAASEEAMRQERSRLAELDTLAFTSECKVVVDAAKTDGRTAQLIGVEIARLLSKENEHLKLQIGVYKGAKPAGDVASVDPMTFDDQRADKQVVDRLSMALNKRFKAKEGRN
jgi:ClpP class serine protease